MEEAAGESAGTGRSGKKLVCSCWSELRVFSESSYLYCKGRGGARVLLLVTQVTSFHVTAALLVDVEFRQRTYSLLKHTILPCFMPWVFCCLFWYPGEEAKFEA